MSPYPVLQHAKAQPLMYPQQQQQQNADMLPNRVLQQFPAQPPLPTSFCPQQQNPQVQAPPTPLPMPLHARPMQPPSLHPPSLHPLQQPQLLTPPPWLPQQMTARPTPLSFRGAGSSSSSQHISADMVAAQPAVQTQQQEMQDLNYDMLLESLQCRLQELVVAKQAAKTPTLRQDTRQVLAELQAACRKALRHTPCMKNVPEVAQQVRMLDGMLESVMQQRSEQKGVRRRLSAQRRRRRQARQQAMQQETEQPLANTEVEQERWSSVSGESSGTETATANASAEPDLLKCLAGMITEYRKRQRSM